MTLQRRWLMASLMLATVSVAQAQQAGLSRAESMAQALNVDVAAALARPAPGKSQLLVYVGSQAQAPFLRDITLRVNDGAAVRYEFSDTESRALQDKALYQVELTGVKDGANQLVVEFHTMGLEDRGIGVFRRGQLNWKFGGEASAIALQLILNKGKLLSDPALDISRLEPGAIAAQIGVADFRMADREYFAAASLLTRLLATSSGAPFSESINKRLSLCRNALDMPSASAEASSGNSDLGTRFNQALSLAQQDQGPAATMALDAIGRMETTDPAALTLRDQANLVLAYYFLNHGQGTEAIPAFERIRSPGPYANAGLLGLGWALLQPPHREGAAGTATIPATARYPTIVTPRLTADIVALKQEQAPRVPVASKDQQNALRKALVPWIELTGRDPTDPAVQEGMLAIAWTLYHFGAYAQAQDDYARAADQFNKMRGWYDHAIENVRSGGMVAAIEARDRVADNGWSRADATLPPARAHWWHGDTPETPKAVDDDFHLERLLLDPRFAESLQDYRNLSRIDRALRDDLAQLASGDTQGTLSSQISALQPALSTAIAQQRAELEGIAIASLSTQKSQLEKYLIEARFALATIYDRPELVSAQ